MRQYTIVPVAGKPDWEKIPALAVDNYQWLPELPITMQAQICYSEAGLHVHLKCTEENIRAECDAPLCEVCEDSCMEFFFRPMEADMRYFNLEINPKGCMFVGFGIDPANLVRLILFKEDAFLEKQARYTPDGWEVFYTVPLTLIQGFFPDFTLTPGRKLYANCYKCGEKTVQSHYMTWNPIPLEKPCFHRPQDFGLMVLG